MIYLIFVTIFFASSVKAEIPYSQKILLEAEFELLEEILRDQTRELYEEKENIQSGKAYFIETRNLLNDIFVFALQELYKKNKHFEFKQMVNLLNNPKTRNHIYYPVLVNRGMSGTHTMYAAFGHQKCIAPIEKSAIKYGTVIELNVGRFRAFRTDPSNLKFTFVIKDKNTKSHRKLTLAKFHVTDEKIFSLLEDLANLSHEYAKYYQCDYINKFIALKKKNKAIRKRYVEIAKIINESPKAFPSEETLFSY